MLDHPRSLTLLFSDFIRLSSLILGRGPPAFSPLLPDHEATRKLTCISEWSSGLPDRGSRVESGVRRTFWVLTQEGRWRSAARRRTVTSSHLHHRSQPLQPLPDGGCHLPRGPSASGKLSWSHSSSHQHSRLPGGRPTDSWSTRKQVVGNAPGSEAWVAVTTDDLRIYSTRRSRCQWRHPLSCSLWWLRPCCLWKHRRCSWCHRRLSAPRILPSLHAHPAHSCCRQGRPHRRGGSMRPSAPYRSAYGSFWSCGTRA